MGDITPANAGSNTTGPLLLTDAEIDAVSGGWVPKDGPRFEIIGGGMLGGCGLQLIAGAAFGVILVGAAPIVIVAAAGGMVAVGVGSLLIYDGIQRL